MQYRIYGQACSDVVMLLHGGGLSWWNYRAEAEQLSDRFQVILPILDGHAGSDRPFTTIEENAAEILTFLDEHFGGRVLILGGLSLGGQIALEMLSQRADVCQFALIESAMVIPSPVTHALIVPAFGSSYGLMKNRTFAKLQAKSLHIRESLFEDYYRDTCGIARPDLIAFMRANTAYTLNPAVSHCTARVQVLAGGKETLGILRSAERIRKAIPGSSMTVLPGLYHGEFSLNQPDRYGKMLLEQLDQV